MKQYTDGLRRALEMEEAMANTFISLCRLDQTPQDMDVQVWEKIKALLLMMQDDTRKHLKLVKHLLKADGV